MFRKFLVRFLNIQGIFIQGRFLNECSWRVQGSYLKFQGRFLNAQGRYRQVSRKVQGRFIEGLGKV